MIKPILRGLLSYTPLLRILKKGKGSKGTGGSDNARYCYSVWLRHLVKAYQQPNFEQPQIIAELGPGDSLGIGICSILTGAEKYYAFDIIEHANIEKNLNVFNELVQLLKNKEPIPNDDEFPLVIPKLSSYDFPNHIFENKFDSLISDNRIKSIRNAIIGEKSDFSLSYLVPWHQLSAKDIGKVDLIFSQAVLEHIDQDEIENTYKKMFEFLKQGGIMSHSIDFSAHETHDVWNGHWRYSPFIWNIIMHGRSYLINRLPYSKHLDLLRELDFDILEEDKYFGNGFDKEDVNKNFRCFKDYDYRIRSAFLQAERVK